MSLTNVTYADAGRYSVRASNPGGCALSSNAWLRLQDAPQILRQPASVASDGAPARFSVVARGTAPLSYQWRFNNVEIPDATASTYTRMDVHSSDEGPYSVVVSNIAGTRASSDATLTVTAAVTRPQIESITLLSNGVQLQISGGPGHFEIEACATLPDWSALTNFSTSESVFTYTDYDTNQPARFYKVKMLP